MAAKFVEVIDYLNAALAFLSLCLAWLALRKARDLEGLSISRALVLDRLYEIYVKLGQVGRDRATPEELAQIINGVIRDHHLLLEQAGLGDFLPTINENAARFSETRRQMLAVGIGSMTEAQQQQLLQSHLDMKAACKALYDAMQPKLRRLFDSPFE